MSISKHQSILNFLVNELAGLVACTYQDNKPFCDIRFKDLTILPAAVLGLH
ncbi:MAG: hypothetical protein RM347_025600 [Nostoc sp. ChiQUE02]